MDRIQSLRRRIAVFGGAVFLLAAALVLLPSPTSAVKSSDLPLVFARFADQSDSARSVEIVQGEKRVALVRREAEWVLESAFDHPARPGKVQALLSAIGRARQQGIATRRAETFGQYAPADGWIQVTVRDAAGASLAELSVGKTRYPEIYLRTKDGESERVVTASDFSADAASVRPREWIDTLLWEGLREKGIVRIEVEQRKEKRTIALARESKPEDEDAPATWKMLSPSEGEADATGAGDLVRSFTGMNIEEIVGGATSQDPEKTFGFDEPTIVVTAHGPAPEKEGEPAPKFVLTIGKKAEDTNSWFVRRGSDSWVFKVADYSLSAFRKEPDAFLVKKPDAGKPADGEEKPPGEGSGEIGTPDDDE
jgi:hypothetical protein